MTITFGALRALCAHGLVLITLSCTSATSGERPSTRAAANSSAPAARSSQPDSAATALIVPASMPAAMTLLDGEICEADAYFSERKRLDVYMMIDDSTSMLPWWLQTVDALHSFWQDVGSAGIGVGLQFFGTACEIAGYATPRVPIAALPDNAAALQQAVPPIPLDETATLPALQGAIQHARSWSTQHPEATVVVLLVTDGLPEECNSTIESVTQAAREGFEGTPSVATWVVGIGDLGALDAFAAAGGTGKALITDPLASQQLVAALNEVRSAALPCDFSLPDGATLQPDRINLRHTETDGAQTTIGAVKDRASCDPEHGGWYFDRVDAPTRIIACEQSCQRLNELSGEVKVLLGCPTVAMAPE